MRPTYLSMIEDAIIILSERKGSSRLAIWKVISSKEESAAYKQFLIQLKRVSRDGTITYASGRYKISGERKKEMMKKQPKRPLKRTQATTKKDSKRKSISSRAKNSNSPKRSEKKSPKRANGGRK